MNEPALNTSTILVSIIIPTFNRAAHLGECLRAISLQTCSNLQVIVINDGGVPVEPVVAQFDQLQLQLINQPTRRGQVAARNKGLETAQGEYIAFCDDDDLWLPTHVDGLVRAAQPGKRLVHSDAEVVVFAASPRGRVPATRELFAFENDLSLLRLWNFIPPSTALYPRRLHDELGEFDETMQDYWDWDWWLRITSHYPVDRVSVASVLVSVDADGTNASADLERMKPNLARLVSKHRLGNLPTSNFALMLREPSLHAWQRNSQVIWDGVMPQRMSK